jgi:rRNA-processing protein FCF1
MLLDTDFLIKVANDPIPKLDLSELSKEYTLATTSDVIRELTGLCNHPERKTSRRASNALRVVMKGAKVEIRILDDKHPQRRGIVEADNSLLELAKANKVTVATLDHSLLSRLERIHLPYLTLRNDKPLLKARR